MSVKEKVLEAIRYVFNKGEHKWIEKWSSIFTLALKTAKFTRRESCCDVDRSDNSGQEVSYFYSRGTSPNLVRSAADCKCILVVG